jgi:chromosome segregation ATPase
MEARNRARSTPFVDRIRRLFVASAAQDAKRIAELEAECARLREHLHESDERGKARVEVFYELQRQYSTEHFELQESMRLLKTERMRNAGAYADREIVLRRAKDLQKRIRELKTRLTTYEAVDDMYFDGAPIVVETPDQREQHANPPEDHSY